MLSGGPLALIFQDYEFRTDGTYIVAVSGGSDSTALLLLLKDHFTKRLPGARLIAATVDHGLRPASTSEARQVGDFCGLRGIEHRILTWTGEKPQRGIQAAARFARHGLLGDLAKRERAAAVFTGHTRDDQVETVLMRLERGDGPGSAGIAPATLYDESVWFLRPLLQVGRSQLQDFLGGRRVGWVEDPSNRDTRFERVRIRAELRLGADGGERAAKALTVASNTGAIRSKNSEAAARLLRDHALLVAPGLVQFHREALANAEPTVTHAVRVLIALAGGSPHLPDIRRTESLLSRLKKGPLRANLSHALIDARKDAIYFLREIRALPEGQPRLGAIWDGRYRIESASETDRVDSSRSTSAPESLVRMATKSEPSLAPGNVALPLLGPWHAFLPVFDFAVACEAARVIGAKAFPRSPMRGKFEATA